MQGRTRYASSIGAVPLNKRPPHAVERGRQRPVAAASASPVYSQRSFSARSRAASSDTRRASSSVGERRVGSRTTSASGRQRGGAGVASTAKHVSFIGDGDDEEQEEGVGKRQHGNFLCPAASLTHMNGSGGGSRNFGTNQVHHLLSELVTISHTLAAYLQDSSARPPSQQQDHNLLFQRSGSQNGSVSRQQQATLKAQEIERIVKRVESHFMAKIASMEQREKEQAAVIAELTKELNSRKKTEDQLPSYALSSSGTTERQMTSPSDHYHQRQRQTDVIRGMSQDCKDSSEEVGHLRRMLQEEKRQRLFVEEQTQSLTEQHGRVVSTLERRLQKQEEQLRDLIASLERQQPGSLSPPNSRSPLTEQSPHFPAMLTPRRLIRQQLPQHEQMQFSHETHHQAPRIPQDAAPTSVGDRSFAGRVLNENNDNDDDNDDDDELIAELGLSGMAKPAVRNAGCTTSVPQALSHPPQSTYHPPFSKPNLQMQHGNRHNAVVADASTARAPRDVDDIALFLDNITQELESIDAMESKRGMEMSAMLGRQK